jgi:hypothetical protein
MKTNRRFLLVSVFALICGLLIAGSARAQIMGINLANSSAVINFLDNNSFNGVNPGSIYTQSSSPWNGLTLNLSQTDSTTLDYANGDFFATGAGLSYNILLNNIVLSQPVGNTGYADLNFQFTVEYQLGGGGLPALLPTSFPGFLVSGTVQTGVGTFASILGSINYYGVDAAGVGYLLDTVNYNWVYNTPGIFNNLLVTGIANNGTTPALGPNSTLTLVGNITFRVDPATITVETVPEPGTLALAGLGAASLFAFRRRLKA